MKKILVIEDNTDIRENICELLELSGYQTTQAANGRTGLELARKQMPDLIICDIMMPDLDGYGVLSGLNQDVKTAGIPFIFLTAKAEKADFRKGMSMGADDYITKPFTEEELLNAVQLRMHRIEMFKSIVGNAPENLEILVEKGNITKSFDEELRSNFRDAKKYKKKELIYLEGHRASYLYYVKKGSVKTFRLHEEGKELITGIYKQGEYFGYYPLLEDSAYKDYAECIENTELILIPKSDFVQLIYSNIDIARQFIKMLTSNVVEKEEQLLHMAYDTLRQRVARTLCDLYEKYKKNDNEPVRITLTREEISKYIGTARESFIRMMSDLKDTGALEIIEGDIVINNLKKLKDL